MSDLLEGLPDDLREAIKEEEGGGLSVTLAVPIDHPNARIESILVRRPTVADLRAINTGALDQGDVSAGAALVARLTKLSKATIDEMDFGDFTVCLIAARRLLPRRGSRDTG